MDATTLCTVDGAGVGGGRGAPFDPERPPPRPVSPQLLEESKRQAAEEHEKLSKAQIASLYREVLNNNESILLSMTAKASLSLGREVLPLPRGAQTSLAQR